MRSIYFIILICLISIITSFNSIAQISDTTKYLEVEFLVTIWNGDTAVSAAFVQQELDQLNNSFASNNTGIQFTLCGEIQFINDPSGQLATGSGSAQYGVYEKRGAIHIWHCNLLSGPAAGLANTDQARIRFGGLVGLWLIEHEMGHILNLGHTHESGNELVDGSNCSTSGDYVCDTPADPGLNSSNVNSNCQYIGAGVDINGDPYNPLTDNYMSYAPHYCRNSFTQGQINRMNNYLNTNGFFINQIDSVRAISSIPSNYCLSDTTSYSFISHLSASTVSGPGVIGNTFYPSLAGPGLHEILIDYPSDSLVYNDFVAAIQGGSTSSSDIWNSYTVINGGNLESVHFQVQVPVVSNMTLEIRNGSGTGGVLIHSQSATVNPTAELEWIQIPISSNLNLNTGQVYTFRLIGASPFTIGSNLYVYPSTNSNLMFAPNPYKNLYSMVVRIKGFEPCGNIGYRYAQVHTPNNGSIVDLKSEYCNTYTHQIELIGMPSNGTFYIDGIQDSIFTPSNLSVGNHLLEFISTDANGCPGYISQSISIIDQMAYVTPSIDSVYCKNSPAISLIGNPNGGTLTIDGDTTSFLDPSTLSLGIHEVNYVYSELSDTIDFAGEENLIYSGWSDYVSLQLDSVVWQEFTPSQGGYLKNIGVFASIGLSNPVQLESTLYKGNPGINNQLLVDTVIVDVNNLYRLIFNSVNNIYLDKDSLYAFKLKRLDATPSIVNLPYTLNDDYAGGISSVDTVGFESYDFTFRTYMFDIAECRDTFSYEFLVDSCQVGLTEMFDDDPISVFPNPTNDILNIQAHSAISQVIIVDLTGRVVMAKNGDQSKVQTLFLGNLLPGNYFAIIDCDDGIYKKKILVYPH